jgi:hypothetical protein
LQGNAQQHAEAAVLASTLSRRNHVSNIYNTPNSNLIHSKNANLSLEEKAKIYDMAVSQLYLLRIGTIALFCHFVPPLLLLVSVFSFTYNYKLCSKLINNYIAFIVSLFAILPLFGLLVMSMTVKISQKKIGEYGFEVTHNKESLEPIKLWLDQ